MDDHIMKDAEVHNRLFIERLEGLEVENRSLKVDNETLKLEVESLTRLNHV